MLLLTNHTENHIRARKARQPKLESELTWGRCPTKMAPSCHSTRIYVVWCNSRCWLHQAGCVGLACFYRALPAQPGMSVCLSVPVLVQWFIIYDIWYNIRYLYVMYICFVTEKRSVHFSEDFDKARGNFENMGKLGTLLYWKVQSFYIIPRQSDKVPSCVLRGHHTSLFGGVSNSERQKMRLVGSFLLALICVNIIDFFHLS